MKCGGTFSKGQPAVCPAKYTTCTSCKYKGHFTRLCKSRRRNVNIVNNQNVDTDLNLSDFPDMNTDLVNIECCGVINAWSESGQSENDDYCIKCHYKFRQRRKRTEKIIKYWPRERKSSKFKYTSGLC